MRNNLLLIITLGLISFNGSAQFDNLVISGNWGEVYEIHDSVTYEIQDTLVERESYKELFIDVVSFDTLNHTKIHVEVLDSDLNILLLRQLFDKSNFDSYQITYDEDTVSVFLGYFEDNRNYKILVRVTNYQGIESEIKEFILLGETN